MIEANRTDLDNRKKEYSDLTSEEERKVFKWQVDTQEAIKTEECIMRVTRELGLDLDLLVGEYTMFERILLGVYRNLGRKEITRVFQEMARIIRRSNRDVFTDPKYDKYGRISIFRNIMSSILQLSRPIRLNEYREYFINKLGLRVPKEDTKPEWEQV